MVQRLDLNGRDIVAIQRNERPWIPFSPVTVDEVVERNVDGELKDF